jgi:hypothetical protein
MRLTLVLGVLGAARAWACPGLTCDDLVLPVPAAGTEIPSNAPAVGVQRTIFGDVLIDGGIEHLTATSAPLQLRGPDGGLVVGAPVEAQLGVFVATPLSEGAWSMALDDSWCNPDAGFVVGPAAPLPTVAATVSLVETQWIPAFEGMTSCNGPYPAQQAVRLRIDASPEMRPWLSLARWELEVDGVNATTARFGRVTAQSYDPPPAPPFPRFNVFTVQCGDVPDGGTAQRFQPGVHAVRVFARILGVAGRIPSDTLLVNVLCTPPDADVVPDAGASDGDAGVAPLDASLDVDAGMAADGGITEPAQSAGCQPAPGPPQSGCSSAGGFEFLAFALLWLRRRAI